MKKMIVFANVLFLLVFAVQGWTNPPHLNIPTKKLPRQFPSPQAPLSQPDLAVTSITAGTQALRVGNEFTIFVKVKNLTPSRNPFTGKPQQARTLPTKLRLIIGNAAPVTLSVPALNPGQYVNLSKKYTPRHPGDLTITAVVDPDNRLRERNRRNNSRTKKFHIYQPADLRIISFNASPNPLRLPGSINIIAIVKNFGGRSQATNMLFTLHGDINNDMDVIEQPKKPVPELARNKTVRITWNYHPVKSGRYTIGGQVDPDNRVVESNESNNVVPRILQVQVKKGGADLDLVSLSVNHHRRHWYQKFIVTAQVTNRGNTTSGPFNVHLYRLFDKPAGWAQGSRKDTSKSCPSLSRGQTCRVQFTFKYKIYIGNPHVSVTVDPEKNVNDYNRHNNTRKLHLTVF